MHIHISTLKAIILQVSCAYCLHMCRYYVCILKKKEKKKKNRPTDPIFFWLAT